MTTKVLRDDEEYDSQLPWDTAGGTAPGKRCLTQNLAPRPIIFRVESAEAARELGAAFGPRNRNGVAQQADAAVDRAASSDGAPLRADVRERFESSLGSDLSSVRVHTGGASAEASAAVGAKAYTVGSDIHFGAGQYQPDDPFGLHLLAHEVAHTQQQASGAPHRQNKLEVSTPGDAAEVEADHAADSMVAGRSTTIGLASAGLKRQQATCDQTQELMRIMDDLTELDDIRDLKYAIHDAELEDDGTRSILYKDARYTVSVSGSETLMEAIAEKESGAMGCTPAESGQSLDSRIDGAIQSKDYARMLELQTAIDGAIAFYTAEPSNEWLIRLGGEEVRSDKATALAAKKRLEAHIPKSVDAMTPDNVKVKNLNVGFQLPKNKKIADGLETGGDGSSVWIGLTREQLGIRFNPPLKTNYHGLPTADVESVALIFLTGAITVQAKGVTAGAVEDDVRKGLYKMLAGSGFEEARYDPFADQWLTVRWENLKTTLAQGGGDADPNQVSAKDIKGFYAGAQIKLDGVSQLDDSKTGLVIDDGALVTVAFASGGTVAGNNLATMGKITVSTNGATILKDGEAAVKLKKVEVGKGCTVKLTDFELLGEAKEAGSLEAFLRLLGGAMERHEAGMPDDAALEHAAKDAKPTFVRGMAQHDIEVALATAIKQAVMANGDTEIEGKKLRDVMGL